MKKRVNPELLRHILFPVHMNFNDVIKKKDAQSLIFFQDNEIKHNLPRYFALFDIMCLDCQIIRSAFSLNVYLTYYHKEDIKGFKKNFLIKGLSRINITKLDIINSLFAVVEEPKIIPKLQKCIKIYMKKYTKNLTYTKLQKPKKKTSLKTLELALFNTKYEKLKSLRRELISKYSILSKYYQIKLNKKKADLPIYKPSFDFRIPKIEVPVKNINKFQYKPKYKPKPYFKPYFKPKYQPKPKKPVVNSLNPLLQYLSKKSKIKYFGWLKDIRLKRLKKIRMYRLQMWAKIRKILNIKPKQKRRRFRKKRKLVLPQNINPSPIDKKNEENKNVLNKPKFVSTVKKEEKNKTNSFQYVKVVSPSLLPKNTSSSFIKENKPKSPFSSTVKKEEENKFKNTSSSFIKENKPKSPFVPIVKNSSSFINKNKNKPKNDK